MSNRQSLIVNSADEILINSEDQPNETLHKIVSGRSYGSTSYNNPAADVSSNLNSSSSDSNTTTSTVALGDMRSLNIIEKVGYGLGHIYNDLCAGVWFSYTLLFLQGALRIPAKEAGILVMLGQVGDALATPVVGLLADRYGTKRKWHIGGELFYSLNVLRNLVSLDIFSYLLKINLI